MLLAQNAVPVAQYNNLRTNANLEEPVLNTANVNVNQFGKLFARTLDGYSYAHPLYVPNLLIPGHGFRNVVYAATLHNTMYAFDAEDPAQSAPYWSVNLGPSIPFPSATYGGYVQPEMGIMSTPAIDLATGTLYVVAAVQQGANAAMFLHALDLATGAHKFGSPAPIQAHVSGSLTAPDRNPDGTITWNPNTRMQRSALLVANGIVYLGFSSYGTFFQYHGWVMAYSASNVQQQIAVFSTTLNGEQGGVWQSGAGFAEDSQGNVYVVSANGTYNGSTDFGNSFIKFGPHLQVLDWFTPSNWHSLFQNDLDLGASGPILLPNSNLLVGAGKQGVVYLVDSGNMGRLETGGSHPRQAFQATPACTGPSQCTEIHSTALWDVSPYPRFYIWGWNDVLRGFRLIGGQFETQPFSQSSVASAYPGGSITVSSLESAEGTGIVWAATTQSSSLVNVVPGTLRAFDAMDLSHELWNSDMNAGRDAMGNLAKFEGPVVANGRVYVPTFSNQLDVYGLLPGSGSLTGSGNSSATLVNLTAEGSVDWEHWGDASLDRKAGAPAQLGNFTIVGAGSAAKYSNDPRSINWTDGAPTASGTNNKNGVYVSGVGHGFAFTAPADTSLRTLIIHVGGWSSGGQFTAHLSDGSALDFNDVTSTASGQYDRNYTLSYHAATAGQSLSVTWKMTSGSGNVTLSAAALVGASITATGGTPQSTPINTAFATALQASLKDASGIPMSGTTVTFTAPGSGPSGSFGGSSTAASTTDGSGIATAPVLTADGQAGGYTVTASVSGIGTPASFLLTNTVVVGSGSLLGTGDSSAALINLTSEGSVDWVHWGDASLSRKAGVPAQLSSFTIVGAGSATKYSNDPRPINWTDGAPTTSGTNNKDGVYVSGVGHGFAFTAPADTSLRTLIVHVGGWSSGGQFTAHLSDGSVLDFTDVTATVSGQYDRNYTLSYRAATAGQTLSVTWKMTSGSGNVTLNAAAL